MNADMPAASCPECGAPLTPGAALGLCARCLLVGAAEPTEPTAPRSAPPSLEQVAAAFPQLEVLELIGHGGMGAVFKVRQPKLDRCAALKLLPQSLAAADPAFASRFEREARLLARLNHANIVAVYDHGQAGDFFYLLMEYVDGVNLRQAMRASRFTPQQALGIVPKICEALQYAHDEGVLHRDIKPENILLDTKGRLKLADFGIAKLAAEADSAPASASGGGGALTHAGASLGTPHYMAPEQRDTPSDVDHRADIYSLGVVFYELLTGELPAGVYVPPSSKSTADPRVDAIVAQALEKERERRQQSAGEVKTQVETMAGDRPKTAPPPASSQPSFHIPAASPAPPPRSSMKTHTQIVALLHIGLGVFALLGAFVIFLCLTFAGGIVISQGEKEAAGILGLVGVFLVGFLAVLALPGIVGGWGLYREKGWARIVVLVLGVLHLANIPFGTALGIYTLWALLNEQQPAPQPAPLPGQQPIV